MNLEIKNYVEHEKMWPQSGRHIMAQYDDESIIVYQAYRPEIGEYAARNGYFGGEFKYSRMSWIKPNFLWMMYRSGWGTKEGQEITLAVRLKRSFFESVLELAVFSSFGESPQEDKDEWKLAVANSDVRLQWDPDHDPFGKSLERRAIQLGMRNEVLSEYGREAVLEIQDISKFVAEQRTCLKANIGSLRVPVEQTYKPRNETTTRRIGL